MRRNLIFAGIVALGLAELGLGAFAATSDVGPEYRAYYIDRTTGCLPRDVPGTYPLGTSLELVSSRPRTGFDHILVCGFEKPVESGTWMRGAEGRLRFDLGDSQRTDLMLKLNASALVNSRFPSQRLSILANGQLIGAVTFDDKQQRGIQFLIPKSVPLTASGSLEIELRMQRLPYAEPRAKDSRLHSLLLRSLWLGPAV